MILFEDFFDELSDDELEIYDNDAKETEDDVTKILSYSHYFMLDCGLSYYDWNVDSVINIKYLYEMLCKIIQDMNFTDNFYIDRPIVKSNLIISKDGKRQFEPIQFNPPYPRKFNILNDIPEFKKNPYLYSTRSVILEFYVYFNKRELIYKSYN